MIWFNLILLVVSFIAMALLAPKPEFENARPQSFDDITFPQATENAPIPLVLGKVRNEGPNTIWYGNFNSVPITERVKTGLFSKKTIIVGYKYYLTLDMALALGPGVSLHEIYIDEELVYNGDTNEVVETGISINAGDLFGGHKEGGGWTSGGTFYSGDFTQTVNSYIEGLLGSGNIPAYRGTSHITFENAYIGESVNLRKMAFVVSKYTSDLVLPNNSKIGDDMNPAEAIWQIMTDDYFGLNIQASQIDITSFEDVGTVLANEGNGVSVIVAKESEARNVITEILRQIDGIMYQDPETGLIVLKLIREDYVADDLLVYDEDDIVDIKSFSRTSWDEVRGQIKVTYKQRDKESTAVAVAQDAGVLAQTGKVLTNSISFPFLYDKDVAQTIAARELSQSSVPLFRAQIEFNRNAYTLRPGSVFKVSWPNYGFEEIIFRVTKFDFGKLTEGKMVVDCLQDSFAVDETLFASKEESGWTAPITSPSDITLWDVPEMHYFHTQRLANPLPDGVAMAVPFPKRASVSSNSFDFAHSDVSGDVTDESSNVYRDPQNILYPPYGEFLADYGQAEGIATGIDAAGFDLTNIEGDFVPAASVAELRQGEAGLLYTEKGEWMGFTGFSAGNVTNVYRGLFGTTPQNHEAGDRVYQFTVGLVGDGFNDQIADTGTLYYKLLDRVGSVVQSAADFTQQSLVMNAEANRPYRPRNAQMDAARTGIVASSAADVSLTWVASDRTELDEVTLETDAAETPDQVETYDVEVWLNGVSQTNLNGTGVTSPYTIPFNTQIGNYSAAADETAEVRIYARRTGGDLRRSSGYAILEFEFGVN